MVPIVYSQIGSRVCKDVTKLHRIWAYPLNAVVNLLGIAIQPIASLITLVAAAIFKLLSLCSEEAFQWNSLAKEALKASAMIFDMHVLFIRIVYPPFQYEEIGKKYDLKER